MIVKMMITFDYNPETNEYVPLKQEIIKENKKDSTTIPEEVKESSEPQVTLTDTKYILNNAAANLMRVKWGDRLDIKYQLVGNVRFPIIGQDLVWNTKSGNKLTKSLTVSCRGSANLLLSEYGNIFTLTPWQGHEGLFVLIGNKDKDISEDISEDIKISEDEAPENDLDFTEEDFSTDDTNYEINDFDFEL